MDRRTFLKIAAALGLTIGVTGLPGCGQSVEIPLTPIDDTLIIVGAGMAGLMAGYRCHQIGQRFQILEAAPVHGGRLKTTTTFADFPIPLGGEWLHVEAGILSELVADERVDVTVRTQGYPSDGPVATWNGRDLSSDVIGSFADRKFVGETWATFLDQYIVPPIKTSIRYNTEVVQVDYSSDRVQLTTASGDTAASSKVLLTVPLAVIKSGRVAFSPALPTDKEAALRDAVIWPGLKVFFEFDQTFYPLYIDLELDEGNGGRLYFDAAFAQATSKHVLGFFAVGDPASRFVAMDDATLVEALLSELEAMYGDVVRRAYRSHIVQNWSREAFIQSAYLPDNTSSSIPDVLSRPVGGKIFFAGEAFSRQYDWGGAHVAARAGVRAVREMLS